MDPREQRIRAIFMNAKFPLSASRIEKGFDTGSPEGDSCSVMIGSEHCFVQYQAGDDPEMDFLLFKTDRDSDIVIRTNPTPISLIQALAVSVMTGGKS
jgi:hypothetical protein